MAFIDQMALELKCGRKLLAGFLFIAANSTISEWSDQRRIKEMQRDAVDMLIVWRKCSCIHKILFKYDVKRQLLTEP